eukprot:g13598.t1
MEQLKKKLEELTLQMATAKVPVAPADGSPGKSAKEVRGAAVDEYIALTGPLLKEAGELLNIQEQDKVRVEVNYAKIMEELKLRGNEKFPTEFQFLAFTAGVGEGEAEGETRKAIKEFFEFFTDWKKDQASPKPVSPDAKKIQEQNEKSKKTYKALVTMCVKVAQRLTVTKQEPNRETDRIAEALKKLDEAVIAPLTTRLLPLIRKGSAGGLITKGGEIVQQKLEEFRKAQS